MERRVRGDEGAQDSMERTTYKEMVDYRNLNLGQVQKMAEMRGTVTLIVLNGGDHT